MDIFRRCSLLVPLGLENLMIPFGFLWSLIANLRHQELCQRAEDLEQQESFSQCGPCGSEILMDVWMFELSIWKCMLLLKFLESWIFAILFCRDEIWWNSWRKYSYMLWRIFGWWVENVVHCCQCCGTLIFASAPAWKTQVRSSSLGTNGILAGLETERILKLWVKQFTLLPCWCNSES